MSTKRIQDITTDSFHVERMTAIATQQTPVDEAQATAMGRNQSVAKDGCWPRAANCGAFQIVFIRVRRYASHLLLHAAWIESLHHVVGRCFFCLFILVFA